jgi:hypothetical protein
VATFVVILVLLAAGCGGDTASTAAGTSDPTRESSAGSTGATTGQGGLGGELAFGLQRCDPDAPFLTTDPASYRDEPVYVANEQPTEEVRAWAMTRPGYQDIWIDLDHNGWISVGFSEDAATRQAELETEFPGVGVVAVEVTATDSELQALRDEVEAALQGLSSWGLGHSVARGMVEVSVPVLDEETLARLAPLAGPRLCVSGIDPADAVPDGPQPTGGEGWRLLGTDRTGPGYRTGVATTPEQYADLWQEAGLAGEGPPVDFGTEIVIWFGAVYGSGCPIRLDDVVVDTGSQLIHGHFVMPGNPAACNDDANSEAYVVAVPRDRLPEAPFAVQLDADEPPAGAPEERTTVQVDLRPAGSTAAAEDLVVEHLDGDGPSRPERFEPDLVIEDGYLRSVLIDLACPVDVIGPVNGTMWRATDSELASGPPAAWTRDTHDGLVEAELLLTTNPAHLTVTINATTADYEPIPAAEEAAMSCN